VSPASTDVLGDVHVAEVARDVRVLLHRASDERDLAPAVDANVNRLLHAMDIRCERRNEDAPLAAREDLGERLADDLLGLGDTRPLGIRRVAEQQVDAAIPDLGELADVGALAIDGRVIDLVVARVHDAATRRFHDDGGGIRYRMRHPHELDPERAKVELLVTGRDLAQLGVAQQAVLVELRLDEPERETRRDDDWDLDLAHQVRQRADVVFVPVREHDAANHRLALPEVGEVRQDEIDAEMLVARKCESCVDDDDRAFRLVRRHVLPDLAETAERDDVCDAHSRPSVVAGQMEAVWSIPARSRHERTRSSSCSVGSTIGSR